MQISTAPPPSVGSSTNIDYLHAIWQTMQGVLVATGGTLPDSSLPTISAQNDQETYSVTFQDGTVITKIKIYTSENRVVTIFLGETDSTEQVLDMAKENVVAFGDAGYNCIGETTIRIINLPINSTIKIYTR